MQWSRTHSITLGVLVGCALVLIGWDLAVFRNEVPGDTISALLWEAARRWWSLAFLMGMLMGHLFWPRTKSVIGVASLPLLGVTVTSVLAVNAASLMFWGAHDIASPVAFAVGFFYGHLTWPNLGKDGE